MKHNRFPRIYGGFFSWQLYSLISLISLFLITTTSCKEDALIGLDLVDNKGEVQYTDTLKITAYSQVEDSVPTGEIGRGVLGVINDPIFGKSRGSFYSEVRLIENNISLGNAPILDSVVLRLNYFSYYGDTLVRQTLRVHEILERIPEDTTIYSNKVIEYNPEPLGVKRFAPRPEDSLLVDDEWVLPHLRVRLSDEFGQSIVDQNKTENFENNANFLEFFKGFFVTVDDHELKGAMTYFDIMHPYSSIVLYYTDGDTDQPKSQRFPINNFCRRYNYFENFGHDAAAQHLKEQLFNDNIEAGDSLIYIQGLHGVRIKLEIPFLQSFENDLGPVTINRAKLIIPVAEEYSDRYFHPVVRLILLSIDEEGEFQTTPDSQLGAALYGGGYNSEEQQYEFNITRHIQKIISGDYPTSEFIIRGTNATENAHRVVLKGPGRSEDNMRIEIIYSVFN